MTALAESAQHSITAAANTHHSAADLQGVAKALGQLLNKHLGSKA